HRSNRGTVGILLNRLTVGSRARTPFSRCPAIALLDNMGQLVGQQRIANRGARRILSRPKRDVASDGKRPGVKRASYLGAVGICGNPRLGEAMAKRTLHSGER